MRDFFLFLSRLVSLVVSPGDEVTFLEVLVGDILTSLSKVFQEVGLAMVATFVDFSVYDVAHISPDILPTILASTPFWYVTHPTCSRRQSVSRSLGLCLWRPPGTLGCIAGRDGACMV